MIDLHCHILPGIDDGPEQMAESMEMARMAVADGISVIVATPHVKDLLDSSLAIAERVEQFQSELDKAGIPLKILPGADVNALLDPALLAPYTVNGTVYILFEFPHTHVPQNADELLFNAMLAGFKPIITHPERNPSFIRNPQLLFDLVKGGGLVQVTAGSLTGFFGEPSKACAAYLLRKKMVHFLATDAHSSRYRVPVLSEGVAMAGKIIGKAAAEQLVTKNPASVIAGHDIYP